MKISCLHSTDAGVQGGSYWRRASGHTLRSPVREARSAVTVYEPRSLKDQTSLRLGWPIALGNMATDAVEAADLSSDFGTEYECACHTYFLDSPLYIVHSTSYVLFSD